MVCRSKSVSRASRAPLCIAVAIAMAAVAPATFAQDAAVDDASNTRADGKATSTLDGITVTGTHIRRVDAETASPVITIGRERIEDSGKSTVGDLLQQLPAMAGYQANTSINSGFSHGRALVSLRNLGSQRTLVLVNGHRMASPASSVSASPGVDVNAIPAAMIERVEVLTDGASSVYGSDAIGGVVNIILKDKYDGMAATVDYGQSGHGDGNRRNLGVEWGKTWENGNLIVGLSHGSNNALYNRSRSFAHDQLSYDSGVIGKMTGSNSRAVLVGGSVVTANSGIAPGSTTASDYHSFGSGAGDRYNYYGDQYLVTPVTRTNFSLHGTYNFSDNVQGYLDMFWTHSKTASRLAAYGIGLSTLTDSLAENYYNPFGSDLSEYYLRSPDVFTREYVSSMAQTSIVGGFRGGFGDSSWQWDANIGYARYKDKLVRYGFAITSGLANAVGASFMDSDGVVKCGSAGNVIAGCTPANVFNPNDPATIAALKSTLLPVDLMDESTMKSAEVSANGNLFALPAGDVQAAFGMVWRKNDFSQGTQSSVAAADAFGNCDYMDGCILNQGRDETVKEAYAEFLIPLLKDLPLISSLNLDIGTRYSRYSAWGGTTNSKVALEWRPIPDLLVRATASEVFRAPALGDLYGSPYNGVLDADEDDYYDPCVGYTGGHDAACANVPSDGSFTNSSQVTIITTGSANAGFDIKPESGRSYDIGVVYDPDWLPGFSVSVDAWRVGLEDMISGASYDYVLDKCYDGDTRYCSLIQRDATGQLSSVTVPYAINYDSVSVRGVDTGVKYMLPWQRFGTFQVGLDATYMSEYRIGGEDHNYVGETSGQGNLPRWRGNLSVSWDKDDWHASWSARYVGKSTVGSKYDGYCYNTSADGSCIYFGVNPVVYHNVSLSRKFADFHTTVSAGIDNLADKTPPIYYGYFSNAANTDASTYDTMGRYFWARVRVEF